MRGGGIGGVAEGAVERAGVFDGVGEQRYIGKARRIEAAAQGGDGAVHHAAGGDDCGARAGVVQRLRDQAFDGLVVLDRCSVGSQRAAMAVAGVFAETEIGDADHRNLLACDFAEQAANHIVRLQGH